MNGGDERVRPRRDGGPLLLVADPVNEQHSDVGLPAHIASPAARASQGLTSAPIKYVPAIDSCVEPLGHQTLQCPRAAGSVDATPSDVDCPRLP